MVCIVREKSYLPFGYLVEHRVIGAHIFFARQKVVCPVHDDLTAVDVVSRACAHAGERGALDG